MAKKKKSANIIQAQKVADKLLDIRFLKRITAIGKALIGDEKFSLIPQYALEAFTICRDPRLKAKAAPGSDIPSSTAKQYTTLFNEFIKEHTIETPYNGEVSLEWYLSEGFLLLNWISIWSGNEFPHAASVKEAFEPYLPGSAHHTWIGDLMEVNIIDALVFLSEANKYILLADMTNTYANPESVTNIISLKRFKPEKTEIVIDNIKREIIRIGWISPSEEWDYLSVTPSQLGFEGEGADTALPVYIQTHALNRLQLRIDITPGIMHYAVASTFIEASASHVKTDNHSLVPYRLSEQKVGYLLCKWCNNKIVVITFLFLTNDGTPEGKKLKKLCLLEKADKEYLRIDTLPHFNSYHFDRDERLSALFTEAGCGSLLKVGHLEEFSKKAIADKDPESIWKYLSDIPKHKKRNDDSDETDHQFPDETIL